MFHLSKVQIKNLKKIKTGKKNDNPNNDVKYNLMSDEEIKKKSSIAICQSIIIFVLAIVWILIGESLNFVSEEVLVSIFLLIIAAGVVNIIYKLSVLPKKESTLIRKNKRKQTHKYDDVLAILFVIIYLTISFITKAWAITWILWIVYALICEILHIMLDKDNFGGEDNE